MPAKLVKIHQTQSKIYHRHTSLLVFAIPFLQQFSISRIIVLPNNGLLLSLRSEKSAIIPTKI